MNNILNNYRNNEKGLLLFNPPTGTGKTHTVLQWIYENYQSLNRKIFFVTNLKKNLPYKELEKLFENDNKQEDFKKDVLFINSNIEFVLDNFLDVVDEIGDNFRDKNFHTLKKRIKTIRKFAKNPYHKEIVDTTKEEVRKTLEPTFREKITRYLKENYPNKKERLYQIKTNKELQWIGKLYPSVFTSKAKIYFLSIDKFFTKNATLVEPSYYFIENDITKNAIVFIDEFDATKERILYKIIEQSTSQKVDYIDLFNKINWSLNNNELPKKILTNSNKRQEEIDKGNKYIRDIENIENILKERAKSIVEEYNVQFSFKTQETQSNSRNLLFQDFKYHSVYKNGKYIRLRPDKNDKVNYLSFEETKPNKNEPNIVTMLNQIKGFLTTFQGVIKELATNYTELVNEQRSKNDIEYTYDLALSTILEEYRLESKYKNFIIDSVLSYRQKSTKEKVNYDLTVYEKGFRYYDFVDDEQHDTITKVFIFNFENTPEKFLLKLAEKSFVVGISATANIETVTGNYDLEYLKRQLGDNFFELTENEKEILKNVFQKRNQNYKEVKIHTNWIGSNNIKEDFIKLFEDKELASHIINQLPDDVDIDIKEQFDNIRIYKISKAFKEFLIHDDIKGFLCLLNKKPKEGDSNLDLKLLNDIFNILIEDVTKKQDFFEKTDNKYNAYIVVDSLEFEETKTEFQKQLEEGKKVFVISMYQTLGAGQNLQYKAPNPDELIDVSNGAVKWNTENKTDFNAIYLDQPTHLIQLVNKTLNEQGFIKYLFQLEFLLEAGYISSQQLYSELKNAFAFLLANNKSNIFNKRIDLYNNKNIRQHFSKYIIQAIGRICRTNLKSSNIYIYADEKIEKYISDFDIENNLVLNEFAELVKHCNKEEILDNKTKFLLNKANVTNTRVNTEIKKYIDRKFEWKWTARQINEWKWLRKQCLKYPILSDEEAKIFSNIINLYIELPEKNNILYYDQTDNFEKIEIDFEKELKYSVSQESARLKDIIHIPLVKEEFEKNKYALEFKKGKYIIPPQLFNNVYKGALGETIGKIIFEKHLGIELEEIENENHFELFDFKVKNTDIFIDFKHWKETTEIKEKTEEILRKLEKVNGSKVLIINILSGSEYKSFNTIDKRIIQIPGLWDIDNRKFIRDNIKIIEEIND